jgi:hypothetical protein
VLGWWDRTDWGAVSGAAAWGDIWLLEGLLLRIPGAQLGRRLIEGNADGAGDVRCDHQENDQALPPDIAAALVVAEFGQVGKRFGRRGALVVAIVDDEAAAGQAIGAQDHAYTRPHEHVPGNRAGSKHPGQGREYRGPQAGACKACPAHGVGDQHGGDTTREPGTRHRRHAVGRTLLANHLVHRVDKGAHKGCRLCNHHRGPPGQSG